MGILIRQSRGKSTFTKKSTYSFWTCNDRYFHRLHVTFIDKDGGKHEFEVAKGDNLLDIAQANDIEMEGMALGLIASTRG